MVHRDRACARRALPIELRMLTPVSMRPGSNRQPRLFTVDNSMRSAHEENRRTEEWVLWASSAPSRRFHGILLYPIELHAICETGLEPATR